MTLGSTKKHIQGVQSKPIHTNSVPTESSGVKKEACHCKGCFLASIQLCRNTMGAANGVAADSGVAASPWSYLACETPCCDQEHSFLVENRNAARLGLSNFEPPHAEMDIKDFKSKGFTRMEIVCASELDTYRINRWAKDESDAELAKQMEGLPPALTSMMALAPPEGYLADGPDGQLVRDFGDTTELVDYDAPNRQASTVPTTPTPPKTPEDA